MAGGKVPGPLDGTKTGPIDKGTLNRQRSEPPGPMVLGHRYLQPWEVGSNRTLIEYFPQGSPAERGLWKHMGYVPGPGERAHDDYGESFEGVRLPEGARILLLPTPGFRATPWESRFGLDYAKSSPKSIPIVDASKKVLGHVAQFYSSEIFAPSAFAACRLSDLVVAGMPAFVRKENPDWRLWGDASPPMSLHQVVVTPGGEVIAVLGNHEVDGGTPQSTFSFIMDVVTIVDGAFLLRSLASSAGKAALSRIDAQLGKRALAAADRGGFDTAGKLAARGKDASPAALARTDLEPPAGLADTIPKPLAAAKEASTLDTGNIAEARMESEHARRMGALNNETFSEIERARLARGPDPLAAYGDDWMQEVSEIIDRVSRKHFPNGVPLD